MMDESKIKAIQEWDPHTQVPQLRSFLSLINYYRRFIKGYSARAAPLTDLLKKSRAWTWDEKCQQAFKDLKKALTEEPVLALPDHTRVFEVHTDASDFAIGGVLMQERLPIAFRSRKLNDTERRYTVQEKEMTAIIHCLRVTSYDKKVDYIMADRVLRKNNFQPYKEYLVKWKGLPESEASSEPANTLWQFQRQIEQYRAERATGTSAALVGENVTPFTMDTTTQDPSPTIGYSKVYSLAYS